MRVSQRVCVRASDWRRSDAIGQTRRHLCSNDETPSRWTSTEALLCVEMGAVPDVTLQDPNLRPLSLSCPASQRITRRGSAARLAAFRLLARPQVVNSAIGFPCCLEPALSVCVGSLSTTGCCILPTTARIGSCLSSSPLAPANVPRPQLAHLWLDERVPLGEEDDCCCCCQFGVVDVRGSGYVPHIK